VYKSNLISFNMKRCPWLWRTIKIPFERES